MAKYKRKTPEDRKKEVEELADKFNQRLDSYFVSEDAMKEHLKSMSNFYSYSYRNNVLIDSQFKGAQAVGSYNFWKEEGLHVKKGEKGIKILVPTPVQYFKRDDKWIRQKYASAKEKALIKQKKIETESKLFFKIGYVFEFNQTNGREKGVELSKIHSNYHRLGKSISDKDHNNMMKGLTELAKELDVTIRDKPFIDMGNAKGMAYTNASTNKREVALNPRNLKHENVPVLIHELAHATMHTRETRNNYSTHEREFQAEMVSYVVSNKYGIDTEEFSLQYLHNWTKGKDMKDKEKLLKEVKETSSTFIKSIDATLNKVLDKEKSKETEMTIER